MAHSQKWGTDYAKNKGMAPAVQPGQTTFQGAAAPAASPTPIKRPKPDPIGSPMASYDDYIDQAFGYAMRSLDPQMEQERSRFDQEMINRGIAPGNEAFMLAEDEMTRGHNDLLTSAAFQAMGFGNQLMQQDRQYGLQSDTFDLNELSTIDSINRAWNDNAYRDAVFNTSREDQQFNQMLSLFGMTPVGSPQPFNMGQSFANSYNADLNTALINNSMWSNVGQGIQEAVPQIWNAFSARTPSGGGSPSGTYTGSR